MNQEKLETGLTNSVKPIATAQAQNFGFVSERAPHVAQELCPFSVGEIIAMQSTVYGLPLNHRPAGIVSVGGNKKAAIESVLPWIDEKAVVDGTNWTWRAAIELGLENGEVNFNELPRGVLLKTLPDQNQQ